MKEVSAILVFTFIILLLNGLFRAFSGSSRLSPFVSTSFKHSTSVGPPAVAAEAGKFCSTEGEICRGAVPKLVPPAYIAEGGEQMTVELFQRNLFMCRYEVDPLQLVQQVLDGILRQPPSRSRYPASGGHHLIGPRHRPLTIRPLDESHDSLPLGAVWTRSRDTELQSQKENPSLAHIERFDKYARSN